MWNNINDMVTKDKKCNMKDTNEGCKMKCRVSSDNFSFNEVSMGLVMMT